MTTAKKSEFQLHDEENWSKCPFCGARNGTFERPLEQHRPRCFYKGPANSRDVVVPNHQQMIDEDDRTYLPMMHAQSELALARKKIKELEEHVARLEGKSGK